jgi:dTDP-4-dehydrorhamnose 3,5-epimerase
MRFQETTVKGAFVIDMEPREDHRGFFARSWCAHEFELYGLNPAIAQINVGFTTKRGGVRGLHFQLPPAVEAKTVRSTKGSIFDIVVDLRPQSPSFKKWAGFELSANNHRMLYIPEGCAHGYQTLLDSTEIEYLTSAPYAPDLARGVRYDDAAFGIEWPLQVTSISEADKSWPNFQG